MWWKITGPPDVATVGASLTETIRMTGLQWLDSLVDRRSAVLYLRDTDHIGQSPFVGIALALAIGERPLARDLYAGWLARNPGVSAPVWIGANGI